MAAMIILIGSFAMMSLTGFLINHYHIAFKARGRVSVVIMFLFTGVSHFYFTEQYSQMLPTWVSERELIIQITGILQILGAVGLLIRGIYPIAGFCLILFLIAVLPSNIYAAIHFTGMGWHVNGPVYLWFRIPLQFLFMIWVWYFTIRGEQLWSKQG